MRNTGTAAVVEGAPRADAGFQEESMSSVSASGIWISVSVCLERRVDVRVFRGLLPVVYELFVLHVVLGSTASNKPRGNLLECLCGCSWSECLVAFGNPQRSINRRIKGATIL